MVRSRPIAVLVVIAMLCLSAAAATPEASLELGLRAFRAGDYASARVDLEEAASIVPRVDASLDSLRSFQTTLVYLALAQFRLGNEDASRATILRLLEAERMVPMYATLPLQAEAAEFETLVRALVPEAALPPNGQVTSPDAVLPLPPVKPVTRTPDPEPEPEPVTVIPRRTEPVTVIPRRTEPAAVPPPVTVTPRVTEALPPLPSRPAAVALDSTEVRNALNSLRQAEALADQGEVREAQAIYARLGATEPREIVAAAAVGLYRVGAYREAVQAFRRLGALGRGEEDLHYYFAVSLYEAGDYETARHELMCALPYIELTEEVARYRIKIEQALINRS